METQVTPLVSVITPTWHRHDLLLDRCVASVQAQNYAVIEHIVVSDGPDPALQDLFERFSADFPLVRYFELSTHPEGKHWGIPARLVGLDHARGSLIAYNDDDDTLQPNHVSLHVAALAANPDAGFSRSLMTDHGAGGGLSIVGIGEPSGGNIGTPMVCHRRELLDIATWGESAAFEDWALFSSWMQAGVQYVKIDEPTIDVWPSWKHGH